MRNIQSPLAVEKGHYCNSTEICTACLIQGGQAVKFGDDRSFLVFFFNKDGADCKESQTDLPRVIDWRTKW